MVNIQPTNIQPPKGAAPSQRPGANLPGGLSWTVDQLGGITNNLKKWLIGYLAQIQALAKLMRLEQGVSAAAEAYKEDPNKKTQKAFFESLKALKDYVNPVNGTYRQFGKNLGPKIQAAIAAEIKEAVFGVGPNGKATGGSSIIALLQKLVDPNTLDNKKWKKMVANWFGGKTPPTDQQFETQLAKRTNFGQHNYNAGVVRAFATLQKGLQSLFATSSSINKTIEGAMGLLKSDIEAVQGGASKVAQKAYQTILTMIKLITGS